MALNSSSHLSDEQIANLQTRLREAEDTLEAIRHGSVDALVVTSREEQEIFTLRSADYTYRVLIESMNQGALTVNFDGMILYSNKQFSEMLGCPLEKVVGNSILDFIMPNDHPAVHLLLQGEYGQDSTLEVELQTADDSKPTVIISSTTVTQSDVKPYLCIVITDMTERKQAEDAKDEFISLASHQLRTPATSVKQYVNMVLDGLFGDLTTPQRDVLERINSSNERGLKIVEDLLKVAQIDAGKIILNQTSVDIGRLTAEVVQDHSTEKISTQNQHIIYKLPEKPVTAYADQMLIRMVIENLLDNASKYMEEGGTITLMTASRKNSTVISISDEGVGMSEEDISKLFQKFARLPNKLSVEVGGNGLGLYWVKKVLDLHNASIAVASKVGEGTTFTITLPQGKPHV